MTEDEMAGWHHLLNRPEFKQALGDGEGQGALVCCSPWGRKDTTERLNNSKHFIYFVTQIVLALTFASSFNLFCSFEIVWLFQSNLLL